MMFKCCICKKEVEGYGNNPEPVKSKGECCDNCNMQYVIPARLQQVLGIRIEKLEENV